MLSLLCYYCTTAAAAAAIAAAAVPLHTPPGCFHKPKTANQQHSSNQTKTQQHSTPHKNKQTNQQQITARGQSTSIKNVSLRHFQLEKTSSGSRWLKMMTIAKMAISLMQQHCTESRTI
jgi:hypothetical protein